MYLANWKGFLPAAEVHVPSSQRGTCLAGWRETFPAGKLHASPTRRKPFKPAIGFGYPWGYPDIRQVWGKDGHPHPLAGIYWYQRITNIRDQLYFQPAIGFGYPWGYPDICQVWGGGNGYP
jgi:hypothetical protein